MFVGRKSELQFLESHFQAEGSRILVLYGRKGVGKTALLREFAQEKNCAYYVARSASEREQRYQWARELAFSGHFMDVYPQYHILFETSLSPFAKSGKKSVLILDEFHNFVKADPEFMSQLISFAERRSRTSPVLILLCSSATGWIENSMISKMGRSAMSLTALLKVRELKFSEMCSLYPGYSVADALMIYGALGGNPGLWNSFSQKLSARENMILHLLSPDSRLYGEMSVYMAEELRETAVYNTLLATMASGVSKLNDLFVHTGFSRAKISVYLKNLMELDLVEKVNSFESGGYENTQKGIYRICNSYVQFYYRFLYPHRSALEICSGSEFYSTYVEPYYGEFLERAYQRACREQLSPECDCVGEWIGKNGIIDIVARRNDGDLLVALCRYTREATGKDFQDLTEYLKQAKLKPAEICIFTEKHPGSDFEIILKREPIKLKSLFGLEHKE